MAGFQISRTPQKDIQGVAPLLDEPCRVYDIPFPETDGTSGDECGRIAIGHVFNRAVRNSATSPMQAVLGAGVVMDSCNSKLRYAAFAYEEVKSSSESWDDMMIGAAASFIVGHAFRAAREWDAAKDGCGLCENKMYAHSKKAGKLCRIFREAARVMAASGDNRSALLLEGINSALVIDVFSWSREYFDCLPLYAALNAGEVMDEGVRLSRHTFSGPCQPSDMNAFIDRKSELRKGVLDMAEMISKNATSAVCNLVFAKAAACCHRFSSEVRQKNVRSLSERLIYTITPSHEDQAARLPDVFVKAKKILSSRVSAISDADDSLLEGIRSLDKACWFMEKSKLTCG